KDTSLVLDAGWVFCLREDAPSDPAAGASSVELQDPHLQQSWALQAVFPEALRFGLTEAQVVRLPFAFAGPAPTVSLPTIDGAPVIEGEVRRALPGSGAQMPLPAPTVPLEDASEFTFAKRGSQAFVLNAGYILRLF